PIGKLAAAVEFWKNSEEFSPARELPLGNFRVFPAEAESEMATAGEPDRGHPRGTCGGQSGQAVLNDEAVGRCRIHLLGDMEKQIGCGLAAPDHRGGEDRADMIAQTRRLERALGAFAAAAGGDTMVDPEGVQYFHDPRHWFQAVVEGTLKG